MKIDSKAISVVIPSDVAPIYWVSSICVSENQKVEPGQLLALLNHVGHGLNASPLLEIRAPQTGFVSGLSARPGKLMPSGATLCFIAEEPAWAGEPLLIYGGGGHGKAVIEVVRAMGGFSVVGVIDDGLPVGMDVLGTKVLGGSDLLNEWRAHGVRMAVNAVGGIGNPGVRERVFAQLLAAGFALPPVTHPGAVIEPSAVLEDGVHVLAQAYVGSAARVGFGSIINAGAIISHDCVLGRVTNLSPGAALAGNVRIEDHAQIGMNASVNLHVTIGSGCVVGNGATVKADVPPDTRVWAGSVWPVRKV